MAALTCSENFLAVSTCLGVKVIELSGASRQTLRIPDAPPSSDSTMATDAASVSKASSECTGQILCIRFSEDGFCLAACNDKKDLAIWNFASAKWEVLNCRKVMRRPVSLAFTLDKKVLLVADKAGDVYSLNVDDDISPKTPILGHVSMLLDLVFSDDNKYVMTAERDEKIRVSHYPNTYNIHSFCLGHAEFVSSLRLLPANPRILVSSSGDCSLRFWNFVEGKELGRIPCVKFTSKQPDSEDNYDKMDVTHPTSRASNPKIAVKGCRCHPKEPILAVLYFGLPEVSLFEVTKYDSTVEWRHLMNISLTKEPWDACFDFNGYLWVLQPLETEVVQVWKPREVGDQLQYSMLDKSSEDPVSSIISTINEDWAFFEGCLEVKTEMSTLFKQWYDNVKDYLQRKEERMSGHAPKRKRPTH